MDVQMILGMTILIVCPVRNVLSMDWRENMGTVVMTVPEDEMDKTKCADRSNGVCKTIQEFPGSFVDNFIKKKSSFNYAEMPGNARVVHFYGSSPQGTCSCILEHQLLDLGRSYYPRYLQTGVCKPDSCKDFNKCVEKRYKVRVLKQKDFADPVYSEPMGMPSILRDWWRAETISVAVACECVPSIKKI